MTLPYVVTYRSDVTGAVVDISNYVVAIPLFTDTGTGEVNTAIIILSGDNGAFVTNPNTVGLVDTTPIINQFDQIKILCSDTFGNPDYQQTFEVRKIIPEESKDSGTKLELHMVGLEANLQVIDFASPFYFTDPFTVVSKIGTAYEANRGINQPILLGYNDNTKNQLPTFTTSTYDFGLNEDKCYNRINEVVDRMGCSVDNGGVLDFYDIKFRNSFGISNITIFSSGSTPVSPITITNSNSVNIGNTKGGIDSQTGSVLGSWGANNQGSLPIDFSKFKSREIIYPLYKQWDNTVSYPQNTRVQWKGSVYLALTSNSGSQPDTHPVQWQLRTQALEYGNTINYSLWTVGRKNLWKNSGCNLSNTPPDPATAPYGIGCWDGNLVLNNDTDVLRVPVDFIANGQDVIRSNATLSKFLYSGTTFYRGLRVLVLGNPTTDLDGTYFGYTSGTAATTKDINGNLIANSVIQYDGSKWVVMYNAVTNMMVSNIYEGMVYQYDTIIAGAWGAIGGLDRANDCFHPYDTMTQEQGVETDPSFVTNALSAIQVKYSWDLIALLTPNHQDYYKFGAWLNFRFPFPHNKINSISENVGQFYGGSTSTGCEPATLDSQNMHYTHDGKIGFNQTSSEDYGPLSDISFDIKLEYNDAIFNLPITGEADFKMRCFIMDTEDNVVYQDFTIGFNGNWESKILPLSGFAIYRGIKPIWTPADYVVPPTQPSPVNVFNWRNIKNICIQTQESYDSSGRYDPTKRYGSVLSNQFPTRYILLTIDSFRFSKPLFVTSGTVSDRVINPDFLQRPNILFYDQLKSDCLAELEKAKFRHKEYDITTTLSFDINFGDSFYFTNPRIVSDSDSGANTIKLVAKRIEYSITKDSGALRTIVGIKRFT